MCVCVCVCVADLTEVKADHESGQVRVEAVLECLRPETKLVCLMLANNETGVIQPVGELVREIRLWEQKQHGKGWGKDNKIFVHTDAAQVDNRLLKITVIVH